MKSFNSVKSRVKRELLKVISYQQAEQIKTVLAFFLFYSGVAYILSLFFKEGPKILVYHSVSDHGVFPDNRISVKRFIGQIAYLEKKYTFIPLTELIRALKRGDTLDQRWIVLTFDDGYADNCETALPVLLEHGALATFYVACNVIGNKIPFFYDRIHDIISNTWKSELNLTLDSEEVHYALTNEKARDAATVKLVISIRGQAAERRDDIIRQIEKQLLGDEGSPGSRVNRYLTEEHLLKMIEAGMDIGSHTISHQNLTSIDAEAQDHEIEDSKKILEKRTGKQVKAFSIPYGKKANYNGTILKKIKNADYQSAVTTCYGTITPKTDCYELPRIGAGDFPLFRLKIRLMGIPI